MTGLPRRAVLVGSLVVLAVLGAFLVETLLSLRTGMVFGHTQQGHLIGWLGLAVTLFVFVYPLKKRIGPRPGWPKRWFQVHMIAGIVGPVIILIHSGAHFHALVPVLSMIAMAVVVLSGIVGQALHNLSLRGLNQQRHELAAQGLSNDPIEARLHDIASREEAFRLWQTIHAPVTIVFVALTLLHVAGALYFGGL